MASRSLDKARAYDDHKGIPQAYGSYGELLADPTIDVIYVPLPTDVMKVSSSQTLKSAENGRD